jgi:hypothetical protein
MGIPKNPFPAKLFCGFLCADLSLLEGVEQELVVHFGPIDFHSALYPFTTTTYYEKELGLHLQRKFVAFASLIDQGGLADIKLCTNRIEQRYASSEGKRRINIDPGYLELGKVVLATTKDRQHRIYIGKGIYAEVTLRYVGKHYQSWEWTYPDYRKTVYINTFETLRRMYQQQLSTLSHPP